MGAFLVVASAASLSGAKASDGGSTTFPAQSVRRAIAGPGVPLKAAPGNAFTAVRARSHAGKGAAATATFVVAYEGFSPEAQAAFQYAVDVWSTLVVSPVPIHIRAVWTTLDLSVLGSAGTTYLFSNFGAGEPDVWYPSALADAISGVDQNPGEPDVIASFNSVFPNWHFGTNGKAPAGTYDFVSVVMHEIGHGLGFAGSMWMDDGTGSTECDGVAGDACWGYPGFDGIPTTYDVQVTDALGTRLIDDPPYPIPSAALGTALRSGAIQFVGPAAVAANGGSPVPLYAPFVWQTGSSYSHLDESTFVAGDPSSLMTPALAMAELIHDPGPVGCGLLADLGWSVASDCGHYVLPAPPPAAPITSMPADGALDVALQPSFVWSPVVEAMTYEIAVHRLPDGDTVFQAEGLADTSAVGAALEEDTRYGWQVRASNESGAGAWSDTAFFLTRVSPPETVVILQPADGGVDIPLQTLLQWEPTARASFYRVELTGETDPVVPLFAADSIAGTSVAAPELSPASSYRWRVQAFNRTGAAPWSTYAAFTTVPDPPDSPDLLNPGPLAQDVPVPALLRWTTVAAADSYRVQFSLASPIPDDAPTFVTANDSMIVADLKSGQTYFWRAKAGNAGGWSRWSRAGSFGTASPRPGAPALLSPAGGAVLSADVVVVAWVPVADVGAYDVQIAADSAFEEVVAELSRTTEAEAEAALSRDRTYHWRVRASGSGEPGAWSETRTFFLMPLPPAPPIVEGPAEGFTVDSASVDLRWNGAGASRFHVQVARDAAMQSVVSEDSLLDVPAFRYAAGGRPGARYWRVRAENAAGWGAWSGVHSFNLAYQTATDADRANAFRLEQNYPNPFNASTRIVFSLPAPGHVRIVVTDALGRTVAVLIDGAVQAGAHEVVFDPGGLATGTYFYRIEANGASATRVMLLVR